MLPEIAAAAPARVGQPANPQRAIEALLHGARRAGLAALVIDDLHFADMASAEMLHSLVLAEGLRLCWRFAQRSAEGRARGRGAAHRLQESQRVEVRSVGPLDEAQLAEPIGSLGVEGIEAAQLAPLLARHTGGNETIKHLIVGETPATDAAALPRPASVGQLIEQRLR